MSTRFAKKMDKAIEKAAAFNSLCPIGTPVRYRSVHADQSTDRATKTRSEAWAMECGMACVMVEGVSGGVSVDHCKILEQEISP